MKDLWIGRIEVLTEPTEFGDTKAFTNVVTRAESPADFREVVGTVCKTYYWSLIGVEQCNPVADVVDITNEELVEALESTKDYPKACIFTTLFYYPSKPL